MDALYEQQLGLALASITEATNEVPTSMYEGEHALRLMIYCIKLDVDGYRLHMKNVKHDILMVILSFIRDVFPISDSFHKKKISIMKELTSIGIPHMAQYITVHKTDPITHTLDIRGMTHQQCMFVMRSLFSW